MAIHVFQIEGMHCGSCALLIDDALQDLPGVRSTHTTIRQQRSTVELDETQTALKEVINTISELGYQAGSVDLELVQVGAEL